MILSDVDANGFDAVFYPGGHGPLGYLVNDKNSIALLENFWKAKKPIAAVCHAPAALLNIKDENGELVLKGKKVTGFSNSEEAAVQLTKVVPFLLEDELKMKGAIYHRTGDWASYVVKDGFLITGQNPASSEGVARELIQLLGKKLFPY